MLVLVVVTVDAIKLRNIVAYATAADAACPYFYSYCGHLLLFILLAVVLVNALYIAAFGVVFVFITIFVVAAAVAIFS